MNVNKLLVFFLFVFGSCTVLSAVMDGEGGFATTHLTSAVDESDTTLSVASTANFLDVDYLWIGDERVTYTGKTATTFTGCTRGTQGTTPMRHSSGEKVYNENSSVMYNALGFNIGVSSTTRGAFSTLVNVVLRVLRFLPRAIAWDYSFLSGKLVLLKYTVLYPLSAGLIFTLAMYFKQLIRI